MNDLDFMMQEEEHIKVKLDNAHTLKEKVNLYWELLEQSDGEITPTIEILELQIKQKKEDTLSYIINKTYDYKGLISSRKEQIKALQESNKSLESKIDKLSNWAGDILTRDGLNKFECGSGKISYRKSTSVNVSDLEALDDKYIVTKETKQADKKLLKDDLKLGAVKGAELIENNNITIK